MNLDWILFLKSELDMSFLEQMFIVSNRLSTNLFI